MLRAIYNNLTKNGVGLITVPSLEYILQNEAYYELVADHLLYFSKGSFRDALTMTDMLVVQNRNIKQDTYSSLFNTLPNSIFQLFLKYITSKDIKKILQLFYYFENKNWLDYSLINQFQNILEENIVNDTNLILNNNYLIKLFQLLIKSNSSDFYENRLSFFLSKLIAIICIVLSLKGK
jgi:DNA polymerase III gamma/tau subunit